LATGAHEDYQRHAAHALPSNRSFAWVMTAFFALIAFWPLVKGLPLRPWALGAAAAFLLAGLLFPHALTPLNRAWMALALLLSRVFNPIMMGLLFYGVFTPIAIIGRLFGRDPLRVRLDAQAPSYWISRTPGSITADSLKNQF